MGLWNWLTAGPRDVQIASPWAPSDRLTRITLNDLYPAADPELWPVTRAEASTVPSVAAARHRIVGTLSRLPMVAEKDGAAWTGPTGLLDQPDDGQPHVTTLRLTLDDLLFDGRAVWVVVKTYLDTGRPLSIVHVPLSDVDVDTDGVATLTDSFTDWLHRVRGLTAAPDPAGGGPWLIGFDGPHPGICSFGGRAIRAAVDLDRASRHAADNPVPSVELHQVTDADMSDDDVRDLIRSWRAARRDGGVGFTNAAIELRTHGQQPEQLLIDGRNQQAVEIARLAGIPAAAIDAGIPGTALTYQNLSDRLDDLVQFGLSPYAVAVTGRLSMNDVLPQGVRARFDYGELDPAPASPNAAAPAASPAPPSLRMVP
jgi:hypothetical protein